MEQGSLISQCAESRVFECNFYGRKAVLKHRFVKDYRQKDLDQKLREQRTVREARALVRCRKFGVPAPTVYAVDRVQSTIIMEFVEGISVRDFMNECKDQLVCGKILSAIGNVVGRMHEGDIIHGDLTTANFLIRGSDDVENIVAIDFGLVTSSSAAEERAVDLYVLERAVHSAHPRITDVEDAILKGYAQAVTPTKLNTTIERLQAVRARGRKRSMIG